MTYIDTDMYLSSLDNLPSELTHIFDELRQQDIRFTDLRRRITSRDTSLGKYIKQNGSLAPNPKEEGYYSKIRADYKTALGISYEKEEQAKKALELMDRYMRKLDEEIKRIVQLEGGGGGLETPGSSSPGVSGVTGGSMGGGQGMHSAHTSPLDRNRPMHKRSRSSLHNRQPTGSSLLSNPPLMPNGYPAPPASYGDPGTEHSDDEGGEDTTTYCFCEQVSYGEMVACDDDGCTREWFHYGCVGLKEPPKGLWYCPDCAPKKKHKKI